MKYRNCPARTLGEGGNVAFCITILDLDRYIEENVVFWRQSSHPDLREERTNMAICIEFELIEIENTIARYRYDDCYA